MLKKKNRLSAAEFEMVFSIGRRIHTENVQLLYTPSSVYKAAVVVPKKICKKAVDRNLVRRKTYHLLREQSDNSTGNYIYIIKKPFLSASDTEKCVAIQEVVGRLSKKR